MSHTIYFFVFCASQTPMQQLKAPTTSIIRFYPMFRGSTLTHNLSDQSNNTALIISVFSCVKLKTKN